MDPYAKNPYSMQWNFGVANAAKQHDNGQRRLRRSGSRRLDVGGYYNVALDAGPGRSARPAAVSVHSSHLLRPQHRPRQLQCAAVPVNKRIRRRPRISGFVHIFESDRHRIIRAGTVSKASPCRIPYHYNNDRSVSGFDLTQVLSVNVVYELPVGRGQASDHREQSRGLHHRRLADKYHRHGEIRSALQHHCTR